jgi:polysaccharide deacetylase family protein (PEP-CTERM system associated)
VQGTFFILGWVAERFPHLVAQIAGRGHEVASHSHWHRLVYTLSPDQFREDSVRAKATIEQAAGMEVRGYRAPSFSITERSLWALDVLAELGFEYDSSVFPIRHDVYGFPAAPRQPHVVQTPSGPITEYPLTTFLGLGRFKFPVGGGGYLRLLPWRYTLRGMGMAVRQGIMPIVYIHPWELDPGQPRLSGRLRSRLRHYTNLGKTEERLSALMERYRFVPFRDLESTG